MPKKIALNLGKYDVLEELGRGGMGVVYLGYDPFADCKVAIKVAHQDAIDDASTGRRYRKLFFNEAKITGMLHHPNIVRVFDAGVENDAWYLVMEYVGGGRTLQRHTRPNTLLAVEDFVRVAFTCAKALDYAHRKGVIHRDIKPKNILLTENGEVKVSDFSVALRTGLDVTETQVDGYLGSPLYMSPEQVRGESLTHKSDIFSLGVLMYELLTGKTPFAAAGIATVIYQITAKEPVPASEVRADIPMPLQVILDRALKKNPDERYSSALELAADLSRIVDELGFEEESLSRMEKFRLVQKLSFFDEFPEPEIWEVLNAGIWQEYEPNDAIIHEGEVDNSFYVIVRGEVAVRKGDTEVDALRQGDCFGEIGFSPGRRRSVGIRAKGQVSAIKIRSSLIEQTSKDTQLRFHKVFLNKIVERLSRANEKIYLERHSQPARRASARG